MKIQDGNWTLFDYDYHTGRSVWVWFNGQETVFRIDYPVEKLIKENVEDYNASGRGWKGDWHRVASVPLNVAYDSGLCKAQSEGDDGFVKRWLNDSDNRYWRTKEGRL